MSRSFRLLALIALFLLPLAALISAQGAPQLPPPRDIPGITVQDDHPRACVDCHVNMPEANLDVRFSTLIDEWTREVPPALLAKAQAAAPQGITLQGRHPALPAAMFQNVPGACLNCHGAQSQFAPPFRRMLHMIHLTGGAENVFLTVYQGECTHCHKLDQATGTWTIPNGAEG